MQFGKDVRVRPEKFGAVIFETLREKVFVTNKTGAEILRLLDEAKTTEEIVTQLAQDYEGAEDIIKNDVEEFIAHLTHQAILQETK